VSFVDRFIRVLFEPFVSSATRTSTSLRIAAGQAGKTGTGDQLAG
jgi:hypothetical protein